MNLSAGSFDIKTGLSKRMQFTIRQQDSASYMGSGSLDVLASPALVAYMEQVSLELLHDFLPDYLSSVGVFISLHHTAPAKLNTSFFCEARIISIENRKIEFDIRAGNSSGELGYAKHTRFLIDKKTFMDKLEATV